MFLKARRGFTTEVLLGLLVAIIFAVAVIIPVAIDLIGYAPGNSTGSGTYAFGVNISDSDYSYLSSAATVAQLLPLLTAVFVLVGIAAFFAFRGD